MQPDSSSSVIDRIIAWLRGLLRAGTSAGGGASHQARDTQPGRTSATRESGSAPPDRRETAADDDIDRRSDFDDAAGDLMTGEETFPPSGSDLDSATHVHDAVGGEDELADDTTDGTIDATRDADLRPAGGRGLQDRDISVQDQLIVDEGASSDEFDGDEVTPGDVDNPYVTTEDVESAAEGYGDSEDTERSNTSNEGTSSLTGSTFTETDIDVPPAREDDSEQQSGDDQGAADASDDSGSFQVVERYNYGEGDLGVGASTAPNSPRDQDAEEDVATADTDASVSPDATRTEIESQSRGDAVNRSDEATQTPGFGDPETFDSATSGTTEPSRSATGNEVEDGQDALGTTLDHSEESDPFSEQAADGSGEEELAVTDENVDFGTERVATFQSGTIAQQGGLASDDVAVDADVTSAAYADLPDEPAPATADDAGEDDLSGSDYPSDRIVDTLDGDDFADAEMPDITDLDSSAGDLDATDPAAQVESVTSPVEDVGSRLDQDIVGTSDEHVGGEEPEFAEAASRGTDETSTDDLGTEARAVDETLAAGSVRGDGGTEAPEGYPVKGNASSMIYHLPDYPSYAGTKAEYYFASEADAIAAGYRPPGNVRRGGAAASDSASKADTGNETSQVTSDPGRNESQRDADDAGDIPAGAVRGDGTTDTPEGYPVKGNANSKIYHLPNFPSYKSTKAEFCFATEQDAINAGYRAPGKRNRGRKS